VGVGERGFGGGDHAQALELVQDGGGGKTETLKCHFADDSSAYDVLPDRLSPVKK
jgi:hypothetical protein